MKVYYASVQRRHDPSFEVEDGGERSAYFESPARVESILKALREIVWAEVSEPADYGLAPIRAVHAEGYLEFLRTAWDAWLATRDVSAAPTQDAGFLPATFVLRRQVAHLPRSLLGRAGYYMMDLSAVIVEGTYDASLASANSALAAAQAIGGNDSGSAFALSRPPGHHAGRDYAAGYCYINNAAVAAQWLSSRGKVAILDIDYHAGNGMQDIFYQRADVLTISLHADPSEEYPYYAGYADEVGAGEGTGFHRNFPLPAGTEDAEYLRTLDQALELLQRFAPSHLIVSLGLDIHENDPLGQFKITSDGILSIGKRISSLRLPTAIIMEGGYNTADLGANVASFLSAFERE